jgi:hypothetical protein
LDIIWTRGAYAGQGPSIGYIENKNGIWINRIIESSQSGDYSYSPYGCAVGDINGDNKPDIAAIFNDTLYAYYNTCTITPLEIPEIYMKKNRISISFKDNVNGTISVYEVDGRLLSSTKINGRILEFKLSKKRYLYY